MRRCMGKVAYARSRTRAKRIPLKSSYGKFANSCRCDDERLASENNFALFENKNEKTCTCIIREPLTKAQTSFDYHFDHI